ncbi:unnamed protein product [Didymodactylos carnosus]|uniref:Potassium channel tetramerisation-type BTB domain-containing protein n=1 Tax=Didymodactylos carnosus TaxID=1234261 RepID=A0A815W3X2_9BILA|nr:unnamed protein product [Didymodactylos carnosus]CAF1604692.1 unnamed protein product [Didymodactylos carnosus]CAF4397028.1 unnamed protein product [Didymodactylos carnosus]CAF4414907.1 unnamed protein product [Didymodactylos carnosus]
MRVNLSTNHLNEYPDSYLVKLVSNENDGKFHSKIGEYFILDEDQEIFSSVIQFYRIGKWSLPHEYIKKLENDIIDKHLLPIDLHKSNEELLIPFYVMIYDNKNYLVTDPPPSRIPEFQNAPFYNRSHSDDLLNVTFVETVNHLIKCGYVVGNWNHEKAYVRLKKLTNYLA